MPLQEQRRNRGFGRALLESIEEIARFLQISRLLLCSTDDNDTKVRFMGLQGGAAFISSSSSVDG